MMKCWITVDGDGWVRIWDRKPNVRIDSLLSNSYYYSGDSKASGMIQGDKAKKILIENYGEKNFPFCEIIEIDLNNI